VVGRSVLDAIGGTPLVELSRVAADVPGRILAKLEYLNPGGSKKDRIALRMVQDAEASGALRPGQTVVELTSGNTGTGLAIVCAVKGHPFVAVMSAGNSSERAQMMRALGAEVVLVAQQAGSLDGHVSGDDLALVEAAAARIAAERGAFRADQFHLPGNPDAHHDGTAAELWAQSGGVVDVFCEFVGTGGTFTGIARYLKSKSAGVACYVVDPDDPSHRIQGGGYGMDELPLLDDDLVDGRLIVTDTDAIDGARRLARREGILAGFSAGACLVAAERVLTERHPGGTAAIVLADSGMKYLSTDLWRDGPAVRVARREDLPVLLPLIDAAIGELQKGFLDDAQIESSRAIMGIDTQLIDDGTYFVVELDGTIVGCGGWSRRATLYGGDHSSGRDAALLEPGRDPAKVRAMYTLPAYARRGIGRLVLERCEAAARADGFTTLELMATLSGRPLYEAGGFEAVEHVEEPAGGTPVPLVRMRKQLS
jgi:cysteine synthase